MAKLRKRHRLVDAFAFRGFRPRVFVQGMFGAAWARLITLDRRGKKTVCGTCGTVYRCYYDRARRRVRDLSCGQYRIWLDLEVRRVDCLSCDAVKRERLEFLLERAPYTRRFARYVGRRCASGTIKDVAKELMLGWDAVKELDK